MPPLFLIRHGESSWNTLGLARGRGGQARLTRRGLRQAADPCPPREPKGGESVRDLYRRAAAFCNDLDDAIADGVVVVAHGGTLRVLHAYLCGVPVEEMSWEPLENAKILRIPEFATR